MAAGRALHGSLFATPYVLWSQPDVHYSMTQAGLQVQVFGESFTDLDDVCTQELEPVGEDTIHTDYRLQWVLGLVYDHDSYQGWNQTPVGEYVANRWLSP